jgi:hypothetical protein
MKLNTLIIDDFLDDPDQIRNLVIDSKVPFEKTGEVPHPGKRTVPTSDPDYKNMIVAKLHEVLPFKIKMRPNFSFSYQLCLSHDETWVHLDPSDWTGVLYLTPNAPIESGTLLFKEDVELVKKLREPGGSGETKAEVMTVLGNVYNRLVLWRGSEIPHRSNLAGFGDCLENGRLTQVFFFDEV